MGTCTFHVQVSTQSFALALHRLAARREVSLRVSSEGHRHTMRVRLKARRHDGWRIVSINHLRWRWLWRVWRVPVVEDFMVYLV
ncbi:TPA: hypothetical protein N3282_005307 [Klebsiella aerogenes]|nr:hypothetical protein [Klebsiella aerogenes]